MLRIDLFERYTLRRAKQSWSSSLINCHLMQEPFAFMRYLHGKGDTLKYSGRYMDAGFNYLIAG